MCKKLKTDFEHTLFYAINNIMNYCCECGSKLILKECFNCGISEGNIPYCAKCETFRFPVFNTAVSMVIYNKDFSKILLIKQYGRNANILVAGYVTKGENLYETVERELREEVNLVPVSVQYNDSQYYEKSNTLICNFIIQTENEEYRLNNEVDSAGWFDTEAAQKEVLPNSLASYFLNLSVKKIKRIKL